MNRLRCSNFTPSRMNTSDSCSHYMELRMLSEALHAGWPAARISWIWREFNSYPSGYFTPVRREFTVNLRSVRLPPGFPEAYSYIGSYFLSTLLTSGGRRRSKSQCVRTTQPCTPLAGTTTSSWWNWVSKSRLRLKKTNASLSDSLAKHLLLANPFINKKKNFSGVHSTLTYAIKTRADNCKTKQTLWQKLKVLTCIVRSSFWGWVIIWWRRHTMGN